MYCLTITNQVVEIRLKSNLTRWKGRRNFRRRNRSRSRDNSRSRRRRRSPSTRKLESILTPSNAIELELRLRDLALVVEGEQVESLDWRLLRADVGEVPVPKDFVATDGVDAEGFGTEVGWGVEDAVEVVVAALEGYAAELVTGSLVGMFGETWFLG